MKTPSQTPALCVRNFGPIGTGFEDNNGYLHFPMVTLFCGPQGSGKSTIAKLYSTCSWIEKNAFRNKGFVKSSPVDTESFRSHAAWQGLGDCFRPDTEIGFRGRHLSFRYALGRITAVTTVDGVAYDVPKIMYIPAERNIASVVKEAPDIKTLPPSLQELLVEFETAKRKLSFLRLPVNGFSYRYDTKKNESWIVNGSAKEASQTHLELASSGLQSMVPLLLVTESIAASLRSDSTNSAETRFGRSASDVLQLRLRFDRLLRTTDVPADVTARMIRQISPSTRFINVVEEPEQNLFPTAQDKVMDRLLEIAGKTPGNQLVASTHSPYLVNHLVLCAKAAEIYAKIPEKDSSTYRKLKKIVHPECAVDIGNMALYETLEDGSIVRVPTRNGLLDDGNSLNGLLGRWNRQFEKLLDIDDDLSNGD